MAVNGVVNELTDLPLVVEPLDDAGEAMVPSSANYKVLCKTTDTVVRQATNIAALQAVMEVELTADDNTIINRLNEREWRRVIVTALNANGKAHVEAFDYYLQRVDL